MNEARFKWGLKLPHLGTNSLDSNIVNPRANEYLKIYDNMSIFKYMKIQT